MPTQWRLKGGAELQALIGELPKRLATNVVRGGLRAGVKVFADDVKERYGAHAESGKIVKGVKISSRVDGTVISAKVSVRGPHAYIAYWLETGVAPHEITVKGKGGLRLGEDIVRRKVEHPGFGEMPVIRPSADTKGPEAVNAMGKYVAARLTWNELKAPALAVEADEE